MSSGPQPQTDQPELHEVIANAINQLTGHSSFRGTQPADPIAADQVEIPCQRTLRGATMLNPKLNGGDLSACFAIVTQNGETYPWFFTVCRVPGEARWQPIASVGGTPKDRDEPFVGKLQGPKSFIAIGSRNEIPDGGRIRIEMPDGAVYEDEVVDGCCIALAPLTTRGGQGSEITIRYFDASGTETGSESI